MAKRGNDINQLIKEAIDASVEFEALMDSTDFNSYLEEEKEEPAVMQTERYKKYKSKVEEACESCENIIKRSSDENNLAQSLIVKLFEAKKIRLEARKQTKWEEEKNKYIKAIHKLHKAFDSIQEENFHRNQKDKKLLESFNWAKVLFYNEMAICYSGLIKSSMSLGYADLSSSLLEELYPKLKNIEERNPDKRKELKEKKAIKDEIEKKEKPLTYSQLLKLHTFALYNKGEAERLLHNDDLSLKTFKKIIEIYEPNNLIEKKSSDYFSALLRMALILIDQGRGKEALDYLEKFNKKIFLKQQDYRFQECEMEKASALIDQKKYYGEKEEDAAKVLKPCIEEKEWENTFTQRKAKVYELRWLIEFKKNRPEDFEKNENQEEPESKIEKIKKKYNEFEKNAKKLLKNCVKRYDGGNFKKTCTYLADYFHEESKNNKKELEKKKKELGCYYLYLCNEDIVDEQSKLRNEFKVNDIIDDWISQNRNSLSNLINLYKEENTVKFDEILKEVDDERYLKGFFETYISICTKIEYKPDEKQTEIIKQLEFIKQLKERLVAVYLEKDNLSELGEVEEKFRFLEETFSPNEENPDKNKNKDNNGAVEFIKKCFFQREQLKKNKKSVFLYPDSILAKMEQNTIDFAEKIIGKTKRFPSDDKLKAVLTVLRRWNSFTPALASSVDPSKGGGYFLYFEYNNKYLGIVIDPGYDFLDNLFSQGFRIGDIDAVIVSHAHPDHTDNLPSILSLFHELNGRLGEHYHSNKFNKEQFNKKQFNKKHLKLIISQGVFDQYYKLIKPSEESLKDIFVIQADREGNNIKCYDHKFDDNYSINIEAFATSHRDLSQWESLGFIIKINNNIDIRRIGYTSDAHWKTGFTKNFKDCNIICVHLGSIVDILGEKDFCSLCKKYKENKDNESRKCKEHPKCKEERFKNGKPNLDKLLKQAREQSHLYLSGLSMFFDELLPKRKNRNNKMELAIISEFGEELKGGIRMDLYHKFDNWFQSKGKARCVPGDIGLEIDLLNANIYCCCCQEFKSKDEISPIAYGKEEGLFFVCEECKSVLSSYQIEEKLKNNYENVRKLELADESRK